MDMIYESIMALFDPYNNWSNGKTLCCAYLFIMYSLYFASLR